MVNSHRICGATEIFEGFRVSWFENQTRNPSFTEITFKYHYGCIKVFIEWRI